jgi:hypothetical protein
MEQATLEEDSSASHAHNDDPDGSFSCIEHTVLLKERFDNTGDESFLVRAIALEREVLQQRPMGHPLRCETLSSLAISLKVHFEITGHITLLKEVIELEKEAVHLQPPSHPDRFMSYSNLAISLKTQFRLTGDETLLDEIISSQRAALQLRPDGHPNRTMSCFLLAVSLIEYFDRTGDKASLDEAVLLQREILRIRPKGDPDRPTCCADLAASLLKHYNSTGDLVSLSESIALGREALRLLPMIHLERPTTCSILAVAFKARFKFTGDVTLLDKAILLEREALNLRSIGHPSRSLTLRNLATSLRMLCDQSRDQCLLEEAMALDAEALHMRDVTPAELLRLLSDSAMSDQSGWDARSHGGHPLLAWPAPQLQIIDRSDQPRSCTNPIIPPYKSAWAALLTRIRNFLSWPHQSELSSVLQTLCYTCILLCVPSIHDGRVEELLNAASSSVSELETRMVSPFNPSTPVLCTVVLHELTRDEWNQLIPEDWPTSALLPASRKFYRLWIELLDSLTYEWGLVMTASAAIITLARILLLSYTIVLTHFRSRPHLRTR